MEQVQSQMMRPEMRQALRMEQARLLEMPEDEFYGLISEIEHSPIFRKLCQQEKLIHYQRFPGTDIASGFYQLKEEAVAGNSSADVESLLLGKERLISRIQELGEAKFKRYFLFPESGMTSEAIARECGLEVARVQEINDLIDRVSVPGESYHSADVATGVRYTRVASLEKDASGFIIGYFSAHLARGRYSVDYEGFERLGVSGSLAEAEAKEARQLFRKLELINSRKDTLTRILQGIIDRQALYLDSGEARSLLPFTQKELAARMGLAASTVSRAISGRSVATPWGAEVPLKHFFPGPKKFRRELLRQVLESGRLASDEAVRLVLQEKFGVAISRRSVASLRQELKYPAARARAVRERGVR